MQNKSDAELVREYAESGSEAAFGEIVRRYADFVYSAALRQVSDAELARDVAQGVFVDLARKAGSLRANTVLIGWLCRGARLAALEHLRTQQRRTERERQAMQLADSSTEIPNDWSAVRPVLDEAIAGLGDEDRNALLLRFFKNESLAAVGVTLGVSEDAAQKRVSRALGRLREMLAARGIHTTAAALSVALLANGVQAAPVGVAASLAAGALAQAATGGAAFSLLNLLTSNSMKTAIVSLVVAGSVAGLTVQQIRQTRTQRELRDAQNTIQQQNESLEALQTAKDQLAAQNDELERRRAEAQDVVRLRGEVTRLRQELAAAQTPAVVQTTAPAPPVTNAAPVSIALSGKLVLLPTESLKALNLPWSRSADGTATSVLSKEQLQLINQALEGASDVKILSSPRVVTSPGVEARFFAGPGMSGAGSVQMAPGSSSKAKLSTATPAGLGGSEAGPGSGSIGGGFGGGSGGSFSSTGDLTPDSRAATGANGISLNPDPVAYQDRLHRLVAASANAVGLNLVVLAYPTENPSSFDLQLTAGFGQGVDRSPQQDGTQNEVPIAQTKARLTLADGQTVVLVKDVPDIGWSDADNAVPGPKSLLVFITPSPFHGATRLANIIHRVTTSQSTGGQN